MDQFTYAEHTEHWKAICKEAPQLLAGAKEQEFERGKVEGVQAGTDAERQRVLEILKASIIETEDGRIIFEGYRETMQMLEDGTSAAACYKKLLDAVKDKRAKGYKQLEAEAPKPVDQVLVDPDEEEAAGDDFESKLQKRIADLRAEGQSFEDAEATARRELSHLWKPVIQVQNV